MYEEFKGKTSDVGLKTNVENQDDGNEDRKDIGSKLEDRK